MGTSSNVLTGDAQLYTAPANTAPPVWSTTVGSAALATWATPWVNPGFSVDGVSFAYDRKTVDVLAEEQSNPVDIVTDTSDVEIMIGLLEDTVQNQLVAYGGGSIAATAAGTTTPGLAALTLSDTLTNLAVAFTAVNSFGFTRLVYIPNIISAGKVSTKYRRAKAPRSYTATFRAICPVSAIQITDATAVVT